MARLGLPSFVFALLALGCGSDSRWRNLGSPPAPSPAALGPGVRVFTGTTAMLYDGPACTAEEGARGDRWCAFVALSETQTINLFVVNVSALLAGTAVSCDAPDPNCLLLTDSLGGDTGDPTWHGTYFQGDTLVYYDILRVPYAWRPGMDRGRLLAIPDATVDLTFCTPARRGTAVACLGLLHDETDTTVVPADLYAGSTDVESEPLLAPVDRVIAANLADQGVARFSFGFPESGYVGWTSRQTPDGPEVLKLQRVDDPASQLTVASDVHGWDVSDDGKRWYWLSAIDSRGAGVLQSAPFPAGAYPSDILPSVWDYGLDRGAALVALTTEADVLTLPDPIGAPENQELVDRGVQSLVALSDKGHLAYAKHFVGTQTVDLFVSKLDGSPACVIDTTVSGPLSSIHFAPGAESALWARSKTGGYDGHHTRLSDCSSVPLAPDIIAFAWIGRDTVIFIDSFDAETETGTLHYRSVKRGGTLDPAEPELIAEGVDTFAISAPALVYTVNGNTEADGVYVRAFGG